MYEVIIVGGGPAGAAAAIYCARKKIKTLIITDGFGGQSDVSDDIGNWIGEISISGLDLAKKYENHVRSLEGEDLEVKTPEKVEMITKTKDGDIPEFLVKTNKGEYSTYGVIVTSGGVRKKLNVPGEKEFDGRGVAYCATCDAPLFRDKVVAVVGGGNAGLEAVEDLVQYATKVYLMIRGTELKGDATTQEAVKNHEKVEILWETEVKEIHGEVMVNAITYNDKKAGEDKKLELQGLFIEIGSVANSNVLGDLVDLNNRGEVITDHMTFETSQKGIYAAGDVTDQIYKQNNISVGNAVSAALSINGYILGVRKKLEKSQ